MDFDGDEVAKEFTRVFNKPISELTVEQLYWLTKVIKHCRLRCRNNSAFNNYMNCNFTGHTFKQVPVEGQDYDRLHIQYKGCQGTD